MKKQDYTKDGTVEKGSDLWYVLSGEEGSYVLDEMARFQEERLLDKLEFDRKVATINIMEELLELWGVGDNKEREMATELADQLRSEVTYLKMLSKELRNEEGFTYEEPTPESSVDALCDIANFAGGNVMQLGYSFKKALNEVNKEIHSRTGEIIEGKFQKHKTPEAKAKWHKADFSGCKL